jgi:hypothetical protein
VPATAQDAAPETPPELKDFRLDTPPPRDKVPEPAPKVTPPPAVPTIETPRPAANTPARPAAKASTPPATKASPTPSTAPVPATPAPEATTAEEPPLVAEPSSDFDNAAEPATTETTAPATDWMAEAIRFWPLLAGLLAALLGLLAFRLWRGRRRDALESIENYAEPETKLPVEAAMPLPASVTPAPTRLTLNASFEPSDARLSLTNLTVTGCLRVRYDGVDPLKSLRLRNMVISACEEQKALIDAFHNDPHAGHIDTLGAVEPGEEIVLTLELQVPSQALQAFDWHKRRFIAPILLLNLDDDDDLSVEPCRINCLVGQEGDPLSPRMQPLPIDRGLNYFSKLRFRPIAT